MASCIAAFASPEVIDEFYSTALQTKSTAHKYVLYCFEQLCASAGWLHVPCLIGCLFGNIVVVVVVVVIGGDRTTRFVTFPDYLVVQMKKFSLNADWTPKKIDVVVDVPFELDISALRATGLQPGEKELPEQPPQFSEPQQPQIDESLVQQLAEMGFAREGCRKAVYHTHNSGADAAMAWIFEHMGDPDFSDPLTLAPKTASTTSKEASYDEDSIVMLTSMGFTRNQALLGLKSTSGNLERAADWLFSHAHELDQLAIKSESSTNEKTGQQLRDGCGSETLFLYFCCLSMVFLDVD
jgi:ubiquitin carboxyl-terminal hydrolase 5/13